MDVHSESLKSVSNPSLRSFSRNSGSKLWGLWSISAVHCFRFWRPQPHRNMPYSKEVLPAWSLYPQLRFCTDDSRHQLHVHCRRISCLTAPSSWHISSVYPRGNRNNHLLAHLRCPKPTNLCIDRLREILVVKITRQPIFGLYQCLCLFQSSCYVA